MAEILTDSRRTYGALDGQPGGQAIKPRETPPSKESEVSTHTDTVVPFPAEAHKPLVLTVEEAAHRLGVGRTVMYALVSSGAVESVRIGRLRRVPVDALTAFLEELRKVQRGPVARLGSAKAMDGPRSTRAATAGGMGA